MDPSTRVASRIWGFNHRSKAFVGFGRGVPVQVDVCGPVVASDDDGRS